MINSTLPLVASGHHYANPGCSVPNRGHPIVSAHPVDSLRTGKQRRREQRAAERRARTRGSDRLGRAVTTLGRTSVLTVRHAMTAWEAAWHAVKHLLPTTLPDLTLPQSIWGMAEALSQAIHTQPQAPFGSVPGRDGKAKPAEPAMVLAMRPAGTMGDKVWHWMNSILPLQPMKRAMTRKLWSTIETFSSAIRNLSDNDSCRKTRLAELRGMASAQRWVSLRTLHAFTTELGYTLETNVPESQWDEPGRPLAYAIGEFHYVDTVQEKIRDIVKVIRRPGDYVLSESDETQPAPAERCFDAPPSRCISVDPPALRADAEKKGLAGWDLRLTALEFLHNIAPDHVPAIEHQLPFGEILARYQAALAQVEDGAIPIPDKDMPDLQHLCAQISAATVVFNQAVDETRPARDRYFARCMEDYDLGANVIGVFGQSHLDGIRDALHQSGNSHYVILRAPERDAILYR